MPEHRRKFSPQFKAEAVQMVISTGKPIAEVARDLGIHDGTLGNWVGAWRREHPEPDQPLSPVERARVKELEDEVARLRMENEFLKKAAAFFARSTRSGAVCGDRRGEGQLQDRLDVPAAGRAPLVASMPGATRRRPPPRRGGASWPPRCAGCSGPGRGAYGCRRVAAQLNREGHPCSVGLVADLMRELGLRACQPRAYKRTTIPGEQPVTSPDLIGRDFTAAAPGQRLVGDITYLRTGEGWLYLATVIDLATKMVTGWQLAEHMRTSLVTDALAMAITHGHVQPGAIFHSDRGCQYGSAEFARFCQANGIRTSVGRTGVCWDNAAAESFFGALKNEMYYRQSFPDRARPGSPSPTTSRCSTTGNGCTQPSATARPFEALTDFQAAATAA